MELFANRPVQQCVSNPVNLKTLIVPLVETEVKGKVEQYAFVGGHIRICEWS